MQSLTSSLISQIESLLQESLNSISILKSSYLSLLNKSEFTDNEATQIESILTTKLVQTLPPSLPLSQEIKDFYLAPQYSEKLQLKPSTDDSLKFLNEFWGLILQSHTKAITSVSVSPDKQLVLSTSDDSTIRLWDLSRKTQKTCIKTHKDRVNCGLFSPDQKYFATGSDDCTVKVWELDDLSTTNTLKGHNKAVKCLSIGTDSRSLISGSSDNTIRIWDLSTYECSQVLQGHTDSINSVFLFDFNQSLASGSSDLSIRLWDLKSSQVKKVFSGHTKHVNSIVINQEDSVLYSGSNDHTIKVWQINSDKTEALTLSGHSDGVLSLALICADQKLVSSSLDQTIKTWKISGECEKSIEIGAVVWDFSVIVNNFLVVGRDDVKVGVFNLNDESFECFPGHTKVVSKVEVGENGEVVVSKSKDGTVRVWRLKSQKEEKVYWLKDNGEGLGDADECVRRLLD